jgi:hypothetical protein
LVAARFVRHYEWCQLGAFEDTNDDGHTVVAGIGSALRLRPPERRMAMTYIHDVIARETVHSQFTSVTEPESEKAAGRCPA